MTKLLSKQFEGRGEVKGFTFTQLESSPKAYLYEVSTQGSKHYEVIARKINTLYNTETYPSSKSFGRSGFTSYNLANARLRFKTMSDTTQG